MAKAVGDVPDTVLVHEGEHAESMTRQLNAEAFTRDGQIYLAGDAPLSSARGQELLAHELTHVVQQRGGTEAMPDESTAAGRDHESAALQVERAVAGESIPADPIELAHATSSSSVPAESSGGEPTGAAPVNVPQGVQRRGREYSINHDPGDDEGESMAPPAVARPNAPAAAPSRPDLVHLQKQQGKFEEVTQRNSNSTLTPRSLRPGSSASMSGEYGHDATSPARANEGRASMSSITGGTHFEGEDQRNTSGRPGLSSPGSEVKESTSMLSKGLSMFEKLTLPPADPFDTDDIDDRRADLERQAHSIYPFIRAKLRAELVKDRERRGRLAREWG